MRNTTLVSQPEAIACTLCTSSLPFTVAAADRRREYKMAAHQVRRHKQPLGAEAKREALAELERCRRGLETGDVLAIGLSFITKKGLSHGFRQAGAPGVPQA